MLSKLYVDCMLVNNQLLITTVMYFMAFQENHLLFPLIIQNLNKQGKAHQSYGKLSSIEIKTNLKQSLSITTYWICNYLFKHKEEENTRLKILHY